MAVVQYSVILHLVIYWQQYSHLLAVASTVLFSLDIPVLQILVSQ